MTLKKNRSNKFTIGLYNTFKDSKLKIFLFEIDKEHLQYYTLICQIYKNNKLDFCTHKTGSGGMHFLSPTMITKKRWKSIMTDVKFVNPSCPMNTLRVKPNKYYNEDSFWYFIYTERHFNNKKHNSDFTCKYLNRVFKTNFEGNKKGESKILPYPLPYPKQENVWIS